jgi:hypothetical protein
VGHIGIRRFIDPQPARALLLAERLRGGANHAGTTEACEVEASTGPYGGRAEQGIPVVYPNGNGFLTAEQVGESEGLEPGEQSLDN